VNKGDHVLNAVLLSLGVAVILATVPSTGLGASSVVRPVSPTRAVVTVAEEFVRFGVPATLGALFPDVDTHFGRHRKTFHNVFVLGVFVAYPIAFSNLQFVWIGVATHLVLDLVGSARGVALLYPVSDTEFGLPGGVATSSPRATAVTVLVTIVELSVAATVHHLVVPLDVNAAVVASALGV
jgi:hypothetical protein